VNEDRPLIAVVDDEPRFCKALARLLKTYGLGVVTFHARSQIFYTAANFDWKF
jgi:FixJ family two-component response regulator